MSTTTNTTAARRQAGFTFAEVLMATVIVGFAVISSSWALAGAVSTKHELKETPFTASQLAKEIYECAEAIPREPTGTVAVTSGGAVTALDNLIGATFSPPILADGSTLTEMADWTQTVDLEVYALDDLTTPTGEDAWLGLSEHAERMFKLTVTIQKDGADVDSFHWWITP
jgi:hypothetical protein